MARANSGITAGFVPIDYSESDLVELVVADNYGTALYPGEPVLAVDDGTVARTPGGSGTDATVDGIMAVIVEIIQRVDADGVLRTNGNRYLPANTRWTAYKDRSLLKCVLANSSRRFKVKADTAHADIAAALTGNFVNYYHAYESGAAVPALGRSSIFLDTSTAATTAKQWRVLDWVKAPYNDPLQVNFHAIVIPNLIQGLPVVGHSTTGI